MLKKVSNTTPTMASIVNGHSTSTQDGYSTNYINGINTYSTTEVDTGKTWTDGKKIYRKCFNYTQTLTANTENIIGTIDNIENLVNLFGNGILSNIYILEFPYTDGTSDITLYIRKLTSTNRVIVVPKSTNITNLNIVVEYTKTTD